MEELSVIADITSLDTAKLRRSARKGRLTRLTHKLEEFEASLLTELRAPTLNRLKEDLGKENRLFKALQAKVEQLLEAKAGSTADDLLKEIDQGIEANECNSDLVIRAEALKLTLTQYNEAQVVQQDIDILKDHGDTSAGEFEKDFNRIQRRIITFQQQSLSTTSPVLEDYRHQFKQSLVDLTILLNHGRTKRREQKERFELESSVVERPAPPPPAYRGSKLKLDLPTFSGHPLDWHNFCELFTSALDRAGEDYSEREKACFLLKAMDEREAEQIVNSHAALESGYTLALQALKARYGSAKQVFPFLVQKVISKDIITFNTSGYAKFRQNYSIPFQAMKELDGVTLSQMVAALALNQFDDSLRDEWTKYFKDETAVPSLRDIEKFISPFENNARSLFAGGRPSSLNTLPKKQPSQSAKTNSSECVLCKETHRLFKCPVFLGYDVSRRFKVVKDKRGCTNCLAFSHATSDCNSSYKCKECNGRHNTLLHRPSNQSNSTTSDTTNCMAINDQKATVEKPPTVYFLHTAMAKVRNGDKESDIRVAIDSGASSSLITESLASRLKLPRHPRRLNIAGACGDGVSRHYVELTLQSTVDQSKTLTGQFNVVSKLPASPPPTNIENIKSEPHIKGLPLADPQFGGSLDVLLGLDCSECITGTLTRGTNSKVSTQPTIFGWTVSGPLNYSSSQTYVLQVHMTEDNLAEDLSRLWELDKTPESANLSSRDEDIVQHFQDTHQVDSDGRYIVKLPRIPNPPQLGKSRNLAVRRFEQNEKSLDRKGRAAEFNAALSEYVQLEHAEIVPDKEMTLPHYYLPVHGVFKSSSTTTKVRPVFDASAPTSTGVSLNDILLQGPNLYPLLSDILLKFRIHPIGFSADISKMFREIKLHPDEKDVHRFLWRDSHGSINDLRMNRLTFGVRCSPYLATQVLRHLACNNTLSHPEASKAILESFYVDDYVSGAASVEEAIKLREQLCDLLKTAGMTLRKWRTCDSNFKESIPSDIIETADLQIAPGERPIKALGIHWNVNTDKLSVAVPTIPLDQPTTKRTIASNIGKVYDVLGFFAPCTIVSKILLRRLWQLQLNWDNSVPNDIHEAWHLWKSQLPVIGSYTLSRKYTPSTGTLSRSLHGFADASQEAYGAVVYVKETSVDGTSHTAIAIAKSRVIPLKGLTIPRAELTAAYLLAKLLKYCSEQLNISDLTAWSDSSIVLCWIRKSPASLKSFVANRVRQIQVLLPNTQWRHVPSASNPADLLSRGTTAEQLIATKLWWNGPPWITQPIELWPTPQFQVPQEIPEIKSVILTAPSATINKIWDRYSKFEQLVRVLSWCRRWRLNRKLPPGERIKDKHLLTSEYEATKQWLISQEQQEHYSEIFEVIAKKKPPPKGHPFRKFHVTTNDNNVLFLYTRVRDPNFGGRAKHLIPLSLKSQLTRTLLQSLHERYLHPGTNTLLATVQETYHIPGLKNYLKGLSRRCPQCQMAYERISSQTHGLLPTTRTTPSAPFTYTGVDFAGPFIVRKGHTRKPVMVKTYACLYVCFATKAIHIELCHDLTTEEFMASLRRFCARRGTPKEIHSDNGTNFVGTRNEYQNIRQMLHSSKASLSQFSCQNNLQWHFIPPRTPNMGGLWEAAIKQMKLLMKKHLKSHVLKTDELASVLVEIEAILNSRPLSPINSTDPDDFVLTPGHFLIGRPLVAPQPSNRSQEKLSSLRRWQLTQRLSQNFWTEWKAKYLQSLQRSQKATRRNHLFKTGDIVFLRDETLPYRQWPMARISATFPGSDNVVRVVDVFCQGKTYRRSTAHLIPFLMDERSSTPPPPSMFRSED